MIIKYDLAKAYDRVQWAFIEDMLRVAGFPPKLCEFIMQCTTSAVIHVHLNGHPSWEFTPERGIRQGDPLSLYIFSLCMERLFH